MADGDQNAVNWQEPGYDEPPRDGAGTNRMITDYSQSLTVKGFKDRRNADRRAKSVETWSGQPHGTKPILKDVPR